jgi:hypothetical protein
MQLNLEKRPTGPPKSGENPEIVVDVALRERFPACSAPGGWCNECVLRAPGSITQTTMETILKMSSGIRPASWSNYSRSSGSFEPLYPYYHYQGAVSGGPGSGKREAGEDRSSLIEPGGYRVQLLGEQVRKDSASRPRHPRGQVRFSPLRVSDQTADVAVGIDEVRAEERH